MSRFPRRSRRRGAVLVLALWISVVLGLVAYSVLQELQIDSRLSALRKTDTQAFYLARTGLARAVVDLQNDLIVDYSNESQPFDCLGDDWANPEDKVEVPFGAGTYTVLVEDESGRIDLNAADFRVLKASLQVLGVTGEDAQVIAAAILDWKDGDTKPYDGEGDDENAWFASLQSRERGARLRDGEFVYRCKNDNFTSLDELLDVYGITPELYYGEKVRKRRLSRAQRKARAKLHREDGTDMEEQTVGLRDMFTVWNPKGGVNVNTASVEVLWALALSTRMDFSTARGLAESAVATRGGAGGNRGDVNSAFRSVKDFQRAVGFPGDAELLSVRSDVFRVIALGEVNGVEHTIRCVVNRMMESYPMYPNEGNAAGVWRQSGLEPPYYKKQRVNPSKDDQFLDPVVRMAQWIEW